jgi:hypothetical protein
MFIIHCHHTLTMRPSYLGAMLNHAGITDIPTQLKIVSQPAVFPQ